MLLMAYAVYKSIYLLTYLLTYTRRTLRDSQTLVHLYEKDNGIYLPAFPCWKRLPVCAVCCGTRRLRSSVPVSDRDLVRCGRALRCFRSPSLRLYDYRFPGRPVPRLHLDSDSTNHTVSTRLQCMRQRNNNSITFISFFSRLNKTRHIFGISEFLYLRTEM